MTARTDQCAELRAATERLAKSPDEQAAYLSSLGVGDLADELGLEFDDFYQSVQHWITDINVSKELAAVDGALSDLSSHQDLWSTASLRTAPEWQVIRDLAARALELTWTVREDLAAP